MTPQEVVDKYHQINTQALADLGCSWANTVDPRGIEYGGALYNRTSDVMHKEIVHEVFTNLMDSGFLEKMTMQQYCSVSKDGEVRFLPDRYVEGQCPACSEDGARGDQCDSCGATYEAHELVNPISKLDPESDIEVRDTEHFFLRLNDFQDSLRLHSLEKKNVWKPNVRAVIRIGSTWASDHVQLLGISNGASVYHLKVKIGNQESVCLVRGSTGILLMRPHLGF